MKKSTEYFDNLIKIYEEMRGQDGKNQNRRDDKNS